MAAIERPEPSLLFVAYGWSPAKEARLVEFCRGLVPRELVWVVRNDCDPIESRFREHRGSNIHAEFSGYLEGMAEIPQGRPLIVANDTLLTHRSTQSWRQLLMHPNLPPDRIFGDFRLQDLEEVQLPMLASWLFYLHGDTQRAQFEVALKHIAKLWGAPPFGERYQEVVTNYLKGGLLHGWIHAGRQSPEAVELKRDCIYAEHRLSQLLGDQIYTPEPGHPLTTMLQRVNRSDRFIALWRRLVSKLRGL